MKAEVGFACLALLGHRRVISRRHSREQTFAVMFVNESQQSQNC